MVFWPWHITDISSNLKKQLMEQDKEPLTWPANSTDPEDLLPMPHAHVLIGQTCFGRTMVTYAIVWKHCGWLVYDLCVVSFHRIMSFHCHCRCFLINPHAIVVLKSRSNCRKRPKMMLSPQSKPSLECNHKLDLEYLFNRWMLIRTTVWTAFCQSEA